MTEKTQSLSCRARCENYHRMALILEFWEEFYTTASIISPKMHESIMDLNCYEFLLVKVTAKERLLMKKSEASASV